MGKVLWADRHVLPLQLMYLTFVMEVDANATESFSQQPRNHTAPVSGYQLKRVDLSSDHLLTGDTEVLITGLVPDTQYRATVYSQAADGTEGGPQRITFRTGMLNFVECLQPAFSSTHFGLL